MKKILSLMLAVLTVAMLLTSCGKKPDIEEVRPRIIELIEASYEINDIFFGDGLDKVDYGEEYDKIIAEYAPKLEEAKKNLEIVKEKYAKFHAESVVRSEEEIAAMEKELKDAEREVEKNTYMFTREEFIDQYDTGGVYTMVVSDKYVTVEDIKAAAELVYSQAYLMSIYETMFVGYIEDGLTDMIYARYYDATEGLMMLKESEVWVTAKRIYDYDTMKIARPSNANKITVTMDSHLEGSDEVLNVRLSFVKQNGEWFLDSPTY